MSLEVNLIWQKKFRLAVLLYVLARYGEIIVLITNIYAVIVGFDTIQVILH
jgi:hypothetical protein